MRIVFADEEPWAQKASKISCCKIPNDLSLYICICFNILKGSLLQNEGGLASKPCPGPSCKCR